MATGDLRTVWRSNAERVLLTSGVGSPASPDQMHANASHRCRSKEVNRVCRDIKESNRHKP